MASEFIASFLQLAKTSPLLPMELVQELELESDTLEIATLVERIRHTGLFSDYQLNQITAENLDGLTYQQWIVRQELPMKYGQRRLLVVAMDETDDRELRIIRKDSATAFETLEMFSQKLHAAERIRNPHIQAILEIQATEEEMIVVSPHRSGDHLEHLIQTIGPMPAVLAAEFIRQVALGLQVIHHAGMCHGDVRPLNLFISPLIEGRPRPDGSTLLRPAPNATVQLTEFGIVPAHPPVPIWPVEEAAALPFLPPERSLDAHPTSAGDVYMLGASFVFLLTAAAPSKSSPLKVLRPDLPPQLQQLIEDMLQSSSELRPTISDVVARLQSEIHHTPPPPIMISDPIPDQELEDLRTANVEVIPDDPLEANEPVNVEPLHFTTSPQEYQPPVWTPQSFAPPSGEAIPHWNPQPQVYQPNPFDPYQAQLESDTETATVSTRKSPAAAPSNRKQLYMWLGIAVVLQLIAVGIWVMIFMS